MKIRNLKEFEKEMEKREWNGQAYLNKVERDIAINGGGAMKVGDLWHTDEKYRFEVVEEAMLEIENEKTGENKTIKTSEMKNYDFGDDTWYVVCEAEEPIYEFRK